MDGLDLLAAQGMLESSPTPQFNNINSSGLCFLYGPTLTSIHDYWKNHSFDEMIIKKKMQQNYEMCLKTIKQWWNETHILSSEHHKLIIARTCFSACTKNKNIRKKWHYTETWGYLPYFSICYQLLAKRQGGRVQEHVLVFCKNSKITTSCWPTVNRRMFDPTKSI